MRALPISTLRVGCDWLLASQCRSHGQTSCPRQPRPPTSPPLKPYCRIAEWSPIMSVGWSGGNKSHGPLLIGVVTVASHAPLPLHGYGGVAPYPGAS
jgi:hypothetical protein